MTAPQFSVRQKPHLLGLMTLLAVCTVIGSILWYEAATNQVGVTAMRRLAADATLSEAVVDGAQITVVTAEGETSTAIVADEAVRAVVVQELVSRDVPLRYEAPPSHGYNLGFALLGVGLIGALAYVASRRIQHGFDVHRFEGNDDQNPRGFDRVAGMEEPKETLNETVAFLKAPQRFAALGVEPPRGVLLTGDPGTGKTMLARAVAEEAGVPFIVCSGSSFQEKFVGVGAQRVRQLFAEAKRLAPCIIFVDEIDAVGKRRGGGGEGASAEHDQTLNQLLVEMDGFDGRQGIVVIGTTNREDILDPALVRPGRFDRKLFVPLPNQRERSAILAVHAKRKAMAPDVDLSLLARSTGGLSGAELANLLNEAALVAARGGDDMVRANHVSVARDRILMGAGRPGMLTDPDERHAIAVHEAGHAVVAQTAAHCDRVDKVTILPRSRSLGATVAIPEREHLMITEEHIVDRICMLMGGRAAELEILRTRTAGAADDLKRASDLARKMVGELGMGELGHLHVANERGELPAAAEDQARTIVERELERARAMVRKRREQFDALVEALILRDTLDRCEVHNLVPVTEEAAA